MKTSCRVSWENHLSLGNDSTCQLHLCCLCDMGQAVLLPWVLFLLIINLKINLIVRQ